MTSPRSQIIDPHNAAAYHCFSRCVRGAHLCGDDPLSGRSLHHRRAWIEQRMLDLCESFAVGLYAWAVMHNHYHLVLVVDPQLPNIWSDEEVARRWCRLTQIPGTAKDPQKRARQERALLRNPDQLAEKRARLGSLSWFMRYMNEGIARKANREDGCKGRFWEGRFGSQHLLDESAMLAGMAYSDLNPIRAGLHDSLAQSRYTAIHRRLCMLTTADGAPDAQLKPLAGPADSLSPAITNAGYVELVDWMGRQPRTDRAAIPDTVPLVMHSRDLSPTAWLRFAAGLEREFSSAVGSMHALRRQANASGRRWLRGLGFTRQLAAGDG